MPFTTPVVLAVVMRLVVTALEPVIDAVAAAAAMYFSGALEACAKLRGESNVTTEPTSVEILRISDVVGVVVLLTSTWMYPPATYPVADVRVTEVAPAAIKAVGVVLLLVGVVLEGTMP